MTTPALFQSFWVAGFESACHINSVGRRLDMIAATQHDRQARRDFELLPTVGIRTARDVVRWHLIDRGGAYDFSSLTPLVEAAEQNGIQVIWNLCHYGWPDDLGLFSPQFVSRYAKYAEAAARHIASHSSRTPLYAPVNEISFFAWAAGRGIIHAGAQGRDEDVKRQLVRAAIAGCDAIWSVDPRARIIHGDPIIHVVPPRDCADLAGAAASQHESQFDAWDMLSGRKYPELGGHPRYLDIVGANFYHANQWEYPDVRLRWEDEPRDERWVPFHRLLANVYERYGRPLFIAETSHFGAGRARWIREIGEEVCRARQLGLPIEGICIYPILDRPDWENPNHWHNSGLWDLVSNGNGDLRRVLNREYADALADVQRQLLALGCI